MKTKEQLTNIDGKKNNTESRDEYIFCTESNESFISPQRSGSENNENLQKDNELKIPVKNFRLKESKQRIYQS